MIHFSTLHDHSCAARASCTVALCAAAWFIAGAAVAQRPAATREPIVINSQFSNIDDATNTARFTKIRISQGATELAAERASVASVGFQNSQWTFEGQVVITLAPHGSLKADQAVVTYRDGALAQVTATGSPAHFEQQQADSLHAGHGLADEITYDPTADTVQMHGHAQLFDANGTQISAPMVIYHVRDDRWQANSGNETRVVHITVKP